MAYHSLPFTIQITAIQDAHHSRSSHLGPPKTSSLTPGVHLPLLRQEKAKNKGLRTAKDVAQLRRSSRPEVGSIDHISTRSSNSISGTPFKTSRCTVTISKVVSVTSAQWTRRTSQLIVQISSLWIHIDGLIRAESVAV